MTNVPRIRSLCLAMGGATLAAVMLAVVMAWILGSSPALKPAPVEPATVAASIPAISSCEVLKSTCARIASAHDAQVARVAYLNRSTDDLLRRLLILFLGCGLATAAAFLHVWWALRPLAKAPGSA